MSEILLVDDDKDMCESLADVLTVETVYNVKYTTSPFEALKMVETEDFSLAIIDYKMPKMNGVELLKRIKQIKPDLVCFILTAFISNELLEEATKEGANKVFSKLVWPSKILEHIKKGIR